MHEKDQEVEVLPKRHYVPYETRGKSATIFYVGKLGIFNKIFFF